MLTTVYHVNNAPDGAIYIGRRMPDRQGSPWANPHKLTTDSPEARRAALRAYLGTIYASGLFYRVAELRGKPLACWCFPKLCHGDLLASLANRCTTHGTRCPACKTPRTASLLVTAPMTYRLRTYCPKCRRTDYAEAGRETIFDAEKNLFD